MVGTPHYPAGGAIIDFIRKLDPAVRRYVQDNAPEEWWTDVKQVYKKALNSELHKRAAVLQCRLRPVLVNILTVMILSFLRNLRNVVAMQAFDTSSSGHAKKAKAAGGAEQGDSSDEPHVQSTSLLRVLASHSLAVSNRD